jgi:hypothetical protein
MFRHVRRGLGTLVALCVLAGAGAAVTTGPAQAAAPTVTCGHKTVTHVAAPGAWKSVVVRAANAGWVTLTQQSPPSLVVKAVAPNPGWRYSVITRSGERIHMSFTKTTSAHLIRFYARINDDGTRLTMIAVACT